MNGQSTGAVAPSDSELVRLFLGGDRRAFEDIVRRHQGRVYSFAYRLLGSASLAEEAAQEVLVKVFKNLHRFRGDSKFTTWLYRITLNHCRNVQAYRGRRQEGRHDSLDREIEDGEGGVMKRELPSGEEDAQDLLLKNERHRALHEELARLEPIWQEVLLLRDVEGRAYEDIGRMLDVAPGTVKSRIHRARRELMTRMQRRRKAEARVS